jgi:hypothetical protein
MKYDHNKFYSLVLLLILFIMSVSCSSGTCFDETEAKSKATFYSMETKISASPDSVSLYGVGLDSVKIYKKAVSPTTIEFPLYYDSVSCKFVIRINGVNDTMEYRYSGELHLLSKECGYSYFFNIDTVTYTKNIIDSVSILKKTVTTSDEENIRIFY